VRVDTADWPSRLEDGGEQADRPQDERRQGERRRVGILRNNVGWTVAGDRRDVAKRFRDWWRSKRSRGVPVVVALVAGGLAAYIATQREPPVAPPAAVAELKPTMQVLVASKEIAVGERLTPASLAWEERAEGALQSYYITLAASPDAITGMSDSVARSQFLPGDPIRTQKLARRADGFLPALLDGGMRGVSVAITAESASGGFISPNEHVDVVLTRSSTAEVGPSVTRSETILHNVLVLAIDSRVSAPGSSAGDGSDLQAEAFTGKAIATLALGPADADMIVNASALGKLSLLLRSANDLSDNGKSADSAANQAIRISSPFWSR
jgi:pilus assembly protein CpaB